MTPSLRGALVGLLAAIACGAERGSPRADVPSTPRAPVPDSFLLRTAGGVEVWFTAARLAKDSAGAPCVERVMDIRDHGRVTPIPLLYTGAAPRLVDDSTIEAAIWLNCRPGNHYRVNLRTGQPVRVK